MLAWLGGAAKLKKRKHAPTKHASKKALRSEEPLNWFRQPAAPHSSAPKPCAAAAVQAPRGNNTSENGLLLQSAALASFDLLMLAQQPAASLAQHEPHAAGGVELAAVGAGSVDSGAAGSRFMEQQRPDPSKPAQVAQQQQQRQQQQQEQHPGQHTLGPSSEKAPLGRHTSRASLATSQADGTNCLANDKAALRKSGLSSFDLAFLGMSSA